MCIDKMFDYMYYKYVFFDWKMFFIGSYNWMCSVLILNEENFIVMNELKFVGVFGWDFECLWEELK